MTGGPHLFQIGFNRCGTRTLARWFARCGYRAAHWGQGRLARDLDAAKRAGTRPFLPWAGWDLISDIEHVGYDDGVLIEGYRDFAYIESRYPDALFLLNTRRKEDWLFSRMRHRGGRYARFYADHYGLSDPRDLLERWSAEWDAHLAAVRAHFADRPGRLIEFAVDRQPVDDLARALAPRFTLDPGLWEAKGAHPRAVLKA